MLWELFCMRHSIILSSSSVEWSKKNFLLLKWLLVMAEKQVSESSQVEKYLHDQPTYSGKILRLYEKFEKKIISNRLGTMYISPVTCTYKSWNMRKKREELEQEVHLIYTSKHLIYFKFMNASIKTNMSRKDLSASDMRGACVHRQLTALALAQAYECRFGEIFNSLERAGPSLRLRAHANGCTARKAGRKGLWRSRTVTTGRRRAPTSG